MFNVTESAPVPNGIPRTHAFRRAFVLIDICMYIYIYIYTHIQPHATFDPYIKDIGLDIVLFFIGTGDGGVRRGSQCCHLLPSGSAE